MNVQLTKRGIKWHAHKAKNLAIKVLEALKLPNNSASALVSIIAYWGLTRWFFFSSFGADALHFDILQDSYNLAIYYYACACFPMISILIILTACQITERYATALEKFTAFVLGLLVVDNVIMGIDAIVNLDPSPNLYAVDEIIQGNPEWIVPIGASDWVLIGVCAVCLIGYLRGSDCV